MNAGDLGYLRFFKRSGALSLWERENGGGGKESSWAFFRFSSEVVVVVN
jgi:hypothetical protein